jgi:hypothetical protein
VAWGEGGARQKMGGGRTYGAYLTQSSAESTKMLTNSSVCSYYYNKKILKTTFLLSKPLKIYTSKTFYEDLLNII